MVVILRIYCLVRRAPVREDVPHDAAFAELRDEIQGAMLRRQFAALGEAAQGEKFPVRSAHVLLVRAVSADAGDEGIHGNDNLIVLVIVSIVIYYNVFGRDSLPSIGSSLMPRLMIQQGAGTQ